MCRCRAGGLQHGDRRLLLREDEGTNGLQRYLRAAHAALTLTSTRGVDLVNAGSTETRAALAFGGVLRLQPPRK